MEIRFISADPWLIYVIVPDRKSQAVQKKGPQKMGDDNISNKLTYLLIGGGIGAILALLFAPKSGQELRGDIAEATRKGIDRSREAAQQLGDRAGEYYEATRGRAAELYSQAADRVSEVAQSARDAASRQTGTLTAAIDAGKKAYQEEKRKTELSGRIDAPNFGGETTN
jgi:gas vesicle protein